MIVEKYSHFRRKETQSPNRPRDDDEEFWSEFRKLMHCYHSAMQVASTQLEILDAEIRANSDHPPIHYMQSRIKSPDSLFEKMAKRAMRSTPGISSGSRISLGSGWCATMSMMCTTYTT